MQSTLPPLPETSDKAVLEIAALDRSGAPVMVRRLSPSDSMDELTALLHRAYKPQMDMGLRPLAGRQTVDVTRQRTSRGECYVAVIGPASGAGIAPMGGVAGLERLVGTILFHEEEDAEGPPWFRRADVDSFSQFAVDPTLQGRGIGRLLLDKVEARSIESGANELGLSMAEPDTNLMKFYERLGYRFVEHWQWPYTNYLSAILSKTLRPDTAPSAALPPTRTPAPPRP
jgi:GNAT superfamily N-acetyltransferase